MAHEDDEPRSNRHRDEDEEYADIRPVSKSRSKKAGMSKGTLIGVLLIGSLMLVVACGGFGGLGYWAYTIYGKSPIVGTWEATGAKLTQRYTFQSDGLGHQKVANIQASFKYSFKEELLEMEPDGDIPEIKGVNRVQRFRIVFEHNEMVWTNIDNNPFLPHVQRFRRVN
jgi:hypothetical protein